jgi:hypothetical protein
MSSRRTLILVASAIALTILSACRERQIRAEKPVAVYVNPDLTLNDYVEPGQKLEWRVNNPQSPTFTFTPQAKLCDPATVQSKAMYHHPAGCVVAQQTYPSGAQFNTYKYTLQLDMAPGAQDPPPVTYTVRVGSCGPC